MWLVLYSKEQDAFHLETGVDRFPKIDAGNGYIVVGKGITKQEADAWLDILIDEKVKNPDSFARFLINLESAALIHTLGKP